MMPGQKSWKKTNFHNTDFLYFFTKHRESAKKVIYQKNIWVTEHLRELNPSIGIKVLTSATYLHISSTAQAQCTMWHDIVKWIACAVRMYSKNV